MPETILRVFLDSNVLLSGLFSDRGAPRLILDVLSLGLPRLKAVTGAFNVVEIEGALKRKLPSALSGFRAALDRLGTDIVPLPCAADLAPLAGMTASKDLPVPASAIAGRAGVLVTGGKKHLLKMKRGALPFRVLAPAEFLEHFLPRFLKGTY